MGRGNGLGDSRIPRLPKGAIQAMLAGQKVGGMMPRPYIPGPPTACPKCGSTIFLRVPVFTVHYLQSTVPGQQLPAGYYQADVLVNCLKCGQMLTMAEIERQFKWLQDHGKIEKPEVEGDGDAKTEMRGQGQGDEARGEEKVEQTPDEPTVGPKLIIPGG